MTNAHECENPVRFSRRVFQWLPQETPSVDVVLVRARTRRLDWLAARKLGWGLKVCGRNRFRFFLPTPNKKWLHVTFLCGQQKRGHTCTYVCKRLRSSCKSEEALTVHISSQFYAYMHFIDTNKVARASSAVGSRQRHNENAVSPIDSHPTQGTSFRQHGLCL